AEPRAGIDHRDRDVRAVDRRGRAEEAVVLDAADALPAAHPGGIDETDLTEIGPGRQGIDAVPCRPAGLGYDASLLADQPVEEARLPDVRTADDREPRLFEVRFRLDPLRQQLDDTVEQVAGSGPIECGDPHRLAEPQSVE